MYLLMGKLWLCQEYVNNNGIIRNACYVFSPDKTLLMGNFLMPNNMPFTPDNPLLRNFIQDYSQMVGIIPVRPMRNNRPKNMK